MFFKFLIKNVTDSLSKIKNLNLNLKLRPKLKTKPKI